MHVDKMELKAWLVNSYTGSCHDHNTGGDIDNIDIGGICEILNNFENKNKSSDRPFEINPVYINSDGGIRELLIICKVGELRILLAHWKYNSSDHDDIPEGLTAFCDWLHSKLKPLPRVRREVEVFYE